VLFHLGNIFYALLVFLLFYFVYKLDALRRRGGIAIYLKHERERHVIPFTIMGHEEYMRSLYNQLRIMTADFSRGASINVPYEEAMYHKIIENSGRLFVPSGTTLIIDPNPGGSISITFEPYYSHKD